MSEETIRSIYQYHENVMDDNDKVIYPYEKKKIDLCMELLDNSLSLINQDTRILTDLNTCATQCTNWSGATIKRTFDCSKDSPYKSISFQIKQIIESEDTNSEIFEEKSKEEYLYIINLFIDKIENTKREDIEHTIEELILKKQEESKKESEEGDKKNKKSKYAKKDKKDKEIKKYKITFQYNGDPLILVLDYFIKKYQKKFVENNKKLFYIGKDIISGKEDLIFAHTHKSFVTSKKGPASYPLIGGLSKDNTISNMRHGFTKPCQYLPISHETSLKINAAATNIIKTKSFKISGEAGDEEGLYLAWFHSGENKIDILDELFNNSFDKSNEKISVSFSNQEEVYDFIKYSYFGKKLLSLDVDIDSVLENDNVNICIIRLSTGRGSIVFSGKISTKELIKNMTKWYYDLCCDEKDVDMNKFISKFNIKNMMKFIDNDNQRVALIKAFLFGGEVPEVVAQKALCNYKMNAFRANPVGVSNIKVSEGSDIISARRTLNNELASLIKIYLKRKNGGNKIMQEEYWELVGRLYGLYKWLEQEKNSRSRANTRRMEEQIQIVCTNPKVFIHREVRWVDMCLGQILSYKDENSGSVKFRFEKMRDEILTMLSKYNDVNNSPTSGYYIVIGEAKQREIIYSKKEQINERKEIKC